MADATSSPPYEISVGGAVESSHFLSFVIERDMFQPDMAAIVLANQEGKYSTKKVGDPVEIKIGDDKTTIYKGEVVGLEPTYKGGEKTRLLIRCMNKFHRLLRFRKSMTFTDKTDKQILSQVVGDAGLSLQWKHDKNITYKHVYQHNQTDMEFLRMRAARMGCHVWCVDTTIHVKEPDLSGSPLAQLVITDPGGTKGQGTIKQFTPRLSSANILKKVTVKGWNPETKELISGDFSVQGSRLGSATSVAGSGPLGNEETYTVDQPIWSKEEAVALAKARLVDLSLSYITGECEITGDARMELGKVVEIIANNEPGARPSDPFNGKYYIMGVTHRYVLSKTKDGGYTTILRLARDAEKE
jgi:phage protein D